MTKSERIGVIKEGNSAVMDEEHRRDETIADFEKAIDATGFGWFNIILLLVCVPAFMSSFFKVSVMSYVIPSAECDLKLTLLEKGVLNSVVFAGMISGGIFWGYIADTRGRKKSLVVGYCLDFICVLCESMSQSVLQLQIFKFLGGFILGGPFAIMLTYVAEMHNKPNRPRALTFTALIVSNAGLVLALLSLLILTRTDGFNFFGIPVRPWQLFLAISGLPSLLAGVLMIFFPETPKYLMSRGENEKALKIFQLIYSINYRKPKSDYPITQLVDELAQNNSNQPPSNQRNDVESVKIKKAVPFSGLKQFRPLFRKPYLRNSLLIYLMSFTILISTDTFRLSLPQLFASMSEYQVKFQVETASMCDIIEYTVNKTHTTILSNDDKICETVFNVDAAYNNIYVAITGIVGFTFMVFLVSVVNRKTMLLAFLTITPTLILSLFFVSSPLIILMAACVLAFLGFLMNTLVIDCTALMFPTLLRSMVVSLALIFGRTGSFLGNLFFPVLMEVHCFAPFGIMSSLYLLALLCSCFLPNTTNMAMV